MGTPNCVTGFLIHSVQNSSTPVLNSILLQPGTSTVNEKHSSNNRGLSRAPDNWEKVLLSLLEGKPPEL